MHDELVIAVLVEALIVRAVAAHPPHPGRGVLRVGNPFGISRMELRVDDGAVDLQDHLTT